MEQVKWHQKLVKPELRPVGNILLAKIDPKTVNFGFLSSEYIFFAENWNFLVIYLERSESFKGSLWTCHLERSERLKKSWTTHQLERSERLKKSWLTFNLERSERLKKSWSTHQLERSEKLKESCSTFAWGKSLTKIHWASRFARV